MVKFVLIWTTFLLFEVRLVCKKRLSILRFSFYLKRFKCFNDLIMIFKKQSLVKFILWVNFRNLQHIYASDIFFTKKPKYIWFRSVKENNTIFLYFKIIKKCNHSAMPQTLKLFKIILSIYALIRGEKVELFYLFLSARILYWINGKVKVCSIRKVCSI